MSSNNEHNNDKEDNHDLKNIKLSNSNNNASSSFSSSSSSSSSSTSLPTEFSIMTYNVYMDGHLDEKHRESTIRTIFESDVDIVCLQESNKGWERHIVSRLTKTRKNKDNNREENDDDDTDDEEESAEATRRMKEKEERKQHYQHYYFFHDFHKYGGCCILSKRYPIVGKPQFLDRCFPWWYGALLVQIELSSTQIVPILIIHLRAPYPSKPWIVQEQRRYELESHLKKVTNNNIDMKNLIIVGDFNNANGPSHKLLKDQGYCNVTVEKEQTQQQKEYNNEKCCFRILERFSKRRRTKKKNNHTWHFSCYGYTLLSLQYDHIYYHPKNTIHFELSDAEVLTKQGGSDHWPVIARFTILSDKKQ